MATYDCFVRIWLPLTSALKPNTSSTGHFDIQINAPTFSFATKAYGSNSDAVTTRTYLNPVISYASDGVTVYNAENFEIPENCLMCKFQFTGDDAGIANVIEWLETYCEYNAAASSSDTHVYKVTSGDFETYSVGEHSCFACAAVWCNLLGYSTLLNIYNNYTYPNGSYDSDGYENYTAWPMFRAYHRGWIFDELNV